MVPPLITLEEHYVSSQIRSHLTDKQDHYAHFPRPLLDKLTDLDTARISDLDAGKVRLQLISHGPLDGPAHPCRLANDELAAACAKHPTRLAGLAMLPMSDPDAAAEELRRCVTSLGFHGALINNHLPDGTFYDAERFWPVFACAQDLDVPVYIHPTFAADHAARHYEGNFSAKAAFGMSSAGWGWHGETGLHVLRLWTAGLFDRYPRLKVIVGHMGEMLPFQLDRIVTMSSGWADRERDLRTVWRENFWVTTSGMFSQTPLACLLKTVDVDHVLYSVDYPFSTNEQGLRFVEELEGSELVSKEDLDKICHGNAERLFKIKL